MSDRSQTQATPVFGVGDIATQAELQPFLARSNLRGAAAVALNWAAIAAIFAGVAIWTNPLTIVLAIILLGGRQLAFAALMHDCGHDLLFASSRANQIVGQWLCAYPILSDQPRYARGHRLHHRLAGSPQDPDLGNYRDYPVTRESFRRKLVRDLTGQTGWKALQATWRRGRSELHKAPWEGNAIAGHLVVHGLMLAALAAAGHAWLFLLWPAAYLTSYMLCARLRQVAEHGGLAGLLEPDPRGNTRTTYVRWWERLFVAPYNLNYHLEHHILSAVPCYHLPAFHHFLKERGAYDGVRFPRGYGELFAGLIR